MWVCCAAHGVKVGTAEMRHQIVVRRIGIRRLQFRQIDFHPAQFRLARLQIQ